MSTSSDSSCPNCAFERAPGIDSCARCGIVFAKFRPRGTRPEAAAERSVPASPAGLHAPDIYQGPLPGEAATAQPAARSSTPAPAGAAGDDPPWKSILFGLLCVGLGLYLWKELGDLEQSGGRVRMNVFVILIYKIAGRTGVLVSFLAGAAVLFWSAIRDMTKR